MKDGFYLLSDDMGPIVIYGKGKAMNYLCECIQTLGLSYTQMDDQDADTTLIQQANIIIATPGIKPSHRLYREYGKKILSELSFFGLLIQEGYLPRWKDQVKVIGITGTNGKSTTTWMCYQMLQKLKGQKAKKLKSGDKVYEPLSSSALEPFSPGTNIHIGGNFDKPLSGIITDIITTQQTHQHHIIVLEVSSFMLRNLQYFHFDIGVFLNLARDHQDRHRDMSDYLLAKANILHHADIAITSAALVEDLSHIQHANHLGDKPIKPGVWQRLKKMIVGLFRRTQTQHGQFVVYEPYELLDANRFPGEHSKRNAGAVHAILQQLFGSYDETLWESVEPLSHRLQVLPALDEITIIDDGICTSAHSLMTALTTQSSPVVLVCGGYDAGDDYTVLKSVFLEKKPTIIVYGQIAPMIYALAKQCGLSCEMTISVPDALHAAVATAKKTHLTTIIFSPGAKSFDLFDNVYHRIRVFEETVEGMRKEVAEGNKK